MQKINQITTENFDKSFDLNDILIGSVFYPAAGINAWDIKYLSNQSNSFVHVDFSASKEVVETAMKTEFQGVGYKIIGLKSIAISELTNSGFTTHNFQLNEYEKDKLNMKSISDNFYYGNFTPFALWAVYELDEEMTGRTEGKIKRFSLLHIGGEACATFEDLYLTNKINPECVAIIFPGESYGDNWTKFTDPDFRFYKSLLLNHENNNASMPKYLLTSQVFMWPNYHKSKRYHEMEFITSRKSVLRQLDFLERLEKI